MNASETESRRYWQLMKLAPSGNCQQKPQPILQSFIQSILTQNDDEPTAPNLPLGEQTLQAILLDQYAHPATQTQPFAELSLRCRISHGIHSACLNLYRQFGESRSFSPADLWRFVLDDQGSTHPNPSHLSLGQDILKTYDRQAASLLSWTTLRVKRHDGLNKFLIEQGIYRLSDWAILNDTKPYQIIDILGEFYSHSSADVDQAVQLLKRYHDVYKAARLLQQQGSGKVTRCTQPSPEQLLAISPNQETRTTLSQLQALATDLRHYRIFSRGGPPPPGLVISTTWSDGTEIEPVSEEPKPRPTDTDQIDFLNLYDQAAQASLDTAIAQAIQQRCQYLAAKERGPRDRLFLKALHRFYCQGESMTVIAKTLDGFKGAQANVSKLLKLKALRADIRHYWLEALQQKVEEIAADYVDAQQLESLDQKLNEALGDSLDAIIQSEQQNSKSPSRSLENVQENLLSARLFAYLEASPQVASKKH